MAQRDAPPIESQEGGSSVRGWLASRARALGHPSFWTAVGSIATALAVAITLVSLADARADERLAQARRISAWPADDLSGRGTLLNASDEPVYGVVLWVVAIQGGGAVTGEEMMEGDEESEVTVIAILPPGTYSAPVPEFHGGMNLRPAIEVAFIDAAGQSWIRRTDGRLEEIKAHPADHYGLAAPLSFEPIEPVANP